MTPLDVDNIRIQFHHRNTTAGLSVTSIVEAFFSSNPLDWRYMCRIIPDWMPNFPRPETRPIMAVTYQYPGQSCNEYLRYSAGPGTGVFWDTYPDNFQTAGLALKVLINAECPPGLWMPKCFESFKD